MFSCTSTLSMLHGSLLPGFDIASFSATMGAKAGNKNLQVKKMVTQKVFITKMVARGMTKDQQQPKSIVARAM